MRVSRLAALELGSWLLDPGSGERGQEAILALWRTCASKFSKQITWIIANRHFLEGFSFCQKGTT